MVQKNNALGSTIGVIDDVKFPSPGDVLTNNEIGSHFSVGNMGGMRRSTVRNLLVLISDPFKGLYQDRWEGDVLHYTGMGKTGDQSLYYSQNRTLLQSKENGIVVHLFEALDHFKYTYIGEAELSGTPYQEGQLDEKGHVRQVWMFPIQPRQSESIPTPTEKQIRAVEESQARLVSKLPTTALRESAMRAPKRAPIKKAQITVFARNVTVAEYVKRLANGSCDLCANSAPFCNKQNEPYLESHHIIWLARGGDDTIDNTVALCPNCHRKMHALDKSGDKSKLKDVAVKRSAIQEI